MAIYKANTTDEDIALEAEAFFAEVGDDDLLRFLGQLPMVWGNDEPMSLGDFIYEAMLWPHVKHAWATVEGAPGLGGRMGQLSRVFTKAERELERDTGRIRRVPRVTNLAAFMAAYTGRGLPV
jgi:hypothetical protein